jgi:hypothetical protein
MKSKLKIVIITFTGTTAFWCLVIISFFWWTSSFQRTGVSFPEDARLRGYFGMMRAWNADKQPVTFTVEEVRTNTTGIDTSRVALLERKLPPSGELWIGIRKEMSQNK